MKIFLIILGIAVSAIGLFMAITFQKNLPPFLSGIAFVIIGVAVIAIAKTFCHKK